MVNESGPGGERSDMANSNARARRVTVTAVLAAAVAVPVLVGLTVSGAPVNSATGDCLAWFGSRDEGTCIGYSTGNITSIGTPDIGIYGPGLGVTTGPLLPGQTITQGLAP